MSWRSRVRAEEEVRTGGGRRGVYLNPSEQMVCHARTRPGWLTAAERRIETATGAAVAGEIRRSTRKGMLRAYRCIGRGVSYINGFAELGGRVITNPSKQLPKCPPILTTAIPASL